MTCQDSAVSWQSQLQYLIADYVFLCLTQSDYADLSLKCLQILLKSCILGFRAVDINIAKSCACELASETNEGCTEIWLERVFFQSKANRLVYYYMNVFTVSWYFVA